MKALVENIRTLLVLGRISNLPTVWSNSIAGWLLAGGRDNLMILVPLLCGGSFLYVGGMYLNDVCDAGFDSQYRQERPIPAREISRCTVGIWTGLWFTLGFFCLAPLGWLTTAIALILLAAIVLYDFHHKNVSWAPVLMGVCRSLLYLLAASAITADIPGYIYFLSAALGAYIAGITYLARGESGPGRPARWGLLLLLLPIVFSLGLCLLLFRTVLPTLVFGLILISWMAWLLVPLWRKTNPSIGRVVSGLLAGIGLVDALQVSAVLPGWTGTLLIPFVGLALLLQRLVPAT